MPSPIIHSCERGKEGMFDGRLDIKGSDNTCFNDCEIIGSLQHLSFRYRVFIYVYLLPIWSVDLAASLIRAL